MKKPDKQTATIQTKLEQFTSMGEKRKEKTFREAFAALLVKQFAALLVKQYLPFSLISEKLGLWLWVPRGLVEIPIE
jgi:hypothetical protein